MIASPALPSAPHGGTNPTAQPRSLAAPGLPTREQALEVAQQFEGIFVHMLIEDMREGANAFGGDGLFGDGAGSSIQSSLFDSMLSDKVAGSGRVGLADALVRDWEAKGHIAEDKAVIQDGLQRLGARERALETLQRDRLQALPTPPRAASLDTDRAAALATLTIPHAPPRNEP